MGCFQAEEPKVPKVSIGPADVVIAPNDALKLVLPAQYAPQAAPNPPVQRLEGPAVTMLKINPAPTARILRPYVGAGFTPARDSLRVQQSVRLGHTQVMGYQVLPT
jgi:hypothetical protein